MRRDRRCTMNDFDYLEWSRSTSPDQEEWKSAVEARRERMKAAAQPKQKLSIRLDSDVVDAFKQLAGDGSYQALINRALHEWLVQGSMERVLQRYASSVARGAQVAGELSGAFRAHQKVMAASPFNIAPERQGELHELRKQLGLTLEFDDQRSIRVDIEAAEIRVGMLAVQRIWGHCVGLWRIAEALKSVPMGAPLPLEDAGVKAGLAALEWGMGLSDDSSALPIPVAETDEFEVFLVALGWILLHEVAHVRLEHQPIASTTDSIKEEQEADRWATEWVLSDWRDYSDEQRVFTKRSIGVVIAHTYIAHIEQFAASFGPRTHPPAFERLMNLAQPWLDDRDGAGEHAEPALYYAIAATVLLLERTHSDWPRTQQFDSAVDCLITLSQHVPR